MFKWLKGLISKLFGKKEPAKASKAPKFKASDFAPVRGSILKAQHKCTSCKAVIKTRNGWYCTLKYSTVKGRYVHYASICGKPVVKTVPKWCPLEKGCK